MTRKKILSLILVIAILIPLFFAVAGAEENKAMRTVYLHAQGVDPKETTNNSTVYMGNVADIYFAMDNPNKGDFADGVHEEPEYDLNGYTLRIVYDPAYFELTNGNIHSPIDYEIPEFNFSTTDKGEENIGDDTGEDVPQRIGYFIYRHGLEDYYIGTTKYAAAYITVFYSGGFVPQKKEETLWYNLAKLTLTPLKPGSTDVFIDIDSGEEGRALELFAKNKSDDLNDQTFGFNAINGGYHHILIKDKSRPAPPMANPTSGSYAESVEITLTAEEDCIIYYTDDGKDPATSSSRIEYTGPFVIENDKTIRTCAFRESDEKYSNTVNYDYEIIPERPYLFYDDRETLLPDIHTEEGKFTVAVSDKDEFRRIADDSEVYYTFSDAPAENIVPGDNPYEGWVTVTKAMPEIEIVKAVTVRLVTCKTGKYSEAATYYLSVKPEPPESNYKSGEYTEKIDVELSCDTADAIIYYTTDGKDPKTGDSRRMYADVPITLWEDTTLRAISYYDGVWSDKVSYYYIFNIYDDFGVEAFYPSGVYEGSVNVTLTPNNPEYTVVYHDGDGNWKVYDEVLVIDADTEITAKAVGYDSEGKITAEGGEYYFSYKIKPLPPEFAPISTQFTNTDTVTIYTPESTKENTHRFTLYYTTDGTDPITSRSRQQADGESDSAIITIRDYTVISAVVLKDGESYSNVVTHSYDIVTIKPVKPLTTLLPGDYTHEIGGEGYSTQFMPVPTGTKIYYTVSRDGGLCPDPIPGTEETYSYDGTEFIEITGNTVIKAVAVNNYGVKSDIGIFAYTVTPEAPKAAPSATINSTRLPVVPVDAVSGSTVRYEIEGFENEFTNKDGERFYIDTLTGNAYRDEECTKPLGDKNNEEIDTEKVTLSISSEMDGVESAVNQYVYKITDDEVLAPPYADKETGMYPEKVLSEDNNNLLRIGLYSLNQGGEIQYRYDNEGTWEAYDGEELEINEDKILQLRYYKNGKYSVAVSYVYNFTPLPPVIELPSGTYSGDEIHTTRIFLDDNAPTDKDYTIFYRENGDYEDRAYRGGERTIDHTMSFKAYVFNEDTERVSRNTIHYYIIDSGNASNGIVEIAYPYDTDRIGAHLLSTGEYAKGIKLKANVPSNKPVEIHYTYEYTYTKEASDLLGDDGGVASEAIFDSSHPIIPTQLMDNIKITAWLVDENGEIERSRRDFEIDFIHLGIPETSLEESGEVVFPKGTKYTLINEHRDDSNTVIYYTTDGSDPSSDTNKKRVLYEGETLVLNTETTVKAVYYNCCGTCVSCKDGDTERCWSGVYGEVGTYKYSIPTSSGGGGGGGTVIDKTRKYTKDIFGNEHPTHIGYINGYPDGSVQPDGYITREEIAAILYRITNHDYEKPFVETGDVFPDVELGRWSVHDIEYMTDKDIIYGYPDGEFKPSRNLTRAEFAALIFRFTKIEKANINNVFTDLDESHWAYDEIIALNKTGLVQGYEDSTFRPENYITRAEVMTVINKLLGRKPLESYIKSLKFNPYNDLYDDKWYYVTVLEATITHNYWLDGSGYEYKWEDWK